jgi:hypothetical protein
MYSDVDEYIVPLGSYGQLKLADAADHIAADSNAACTGAVLLRPLNFGPSASINRSDENSLVIQNFKRAAATPKRDLYESKYFAKPTSVNALSIRILPLQVALNLDMILLWVCP